ncbi:MAG: TerB family tellurite resistance protein [Ignavibacteriaceae bacterium]|nr:TerB family tellurite resistance protein [Ignavibacteriaceae bacterium]
MNLQERKNLKNIGYLYLAFAHLTDSELSEKELNEILKQLRKYTAEFSETEFERFLEETMRWYNDTADSRVEMVQMIAGKIHYEVDDVLKESFLKDLVAIAKADDDFIEAEKNLINTLSNAWGLDVKL